MFTRLMLGLIPLLCLAALPPNEVLAASSADVTASTNIGPGGRPVGPAWSRSPVYAANGMAATAQPLASQIAIDILKAGGTAVDAAIAANAALGLMEPTGNGIGGDLFAIVWDPKTAKLHGLNASGRSPQSRSLERLKEQLAGTDSIPPLGHLPVTVPGTVDGWFELHQRFGNLPMQKVLAPAIQYAKEGFPVSPVIAYYFQRAEAAFNRRLAMIDEFDNAKRTYFTPRAPKPVRSSATPTWLRLTAKSPARAETFSIRAPSPKPSTPTCSVLAATYAWPTLSPTKVNG